MPRPAAADPLPTGMSPADEPVPPGAADPQPPRLAAAALTGGGRVAIGALSALWVTPFALAQLGAARFGLWALAGGLLGLLRLADLGLGRALSRRVAQVAGTAGADGAGKAASAMATARGLAFLTGAGGIALVALCLPVLTDPRLGIPTDLAREAGGMLLGTAVVAALEGFFAPGPAALEGLGRLERVNLIDAVVQRLLSPWLVLPVLWAGGGLMGLVLKNAVMALLAGFWTQRELKRADPRLAAARPVLSSAGAGELLRFGRHAQAVNLASALVDPVAKALLGAASGLGAVAAYELAARVAGQLGAACMAAAAGLFPAAARLEGIAAQPDRRQALLDLHARARRWMDRLVLSGWSLVAVLAPDFCRLWLGGELAPAVARALQILSPGWMLALIALPAFLITQAAGTAARSTAAGLCTAAVSLGGAYLARLWGLAGVAAAVAAGLAAGGLWMLLSFAWEQDLGVLELLPDGRAVLAAATGALAAGVLVAWGLAGWPILLLAGAVGTAAALATLRLSGEMADEDWALIGALGRRLLGRREAWS